MDSTRPRQQRKGEMQDLRQGNRHCKHGGVGIKKPHGVQKARPSFEENKVMWIYNKFLQSCSAGATSNPDKTQTDKVIFQLILVQRSRQ